MKITAEFIRQIHNYKDDDKLHNILNRLIFDSYRYLSSVVYAPNLDTKIITELQARGFTVKCEPESKDQDAWKYYTITWSK